MDDVINTNDDIAQVPHVDPHRYETATCATCGGDGWVIVPGHACGDDDNLCPHTCPEPQWEPCPDRCPTSGNTAGTTANTVDDEPF